MEDKVISPSAIVRYRGPSDTKGSRYTVSINGIYCGSVGYAHEISGTANRVAYSVEQILNRRQDLRYVPGKVFSIGNCVYCVELIVTK